VLPDSQLQTNYVQLFLKILYFSRISVTTKANQWSELIPFAFLYSTSEINTFINIIPLPAPVESNLISSNKLHEDYSLLGRDVVQYT
jgi:hypothetical protein